MMSLRQRIVEANLPNRENLNKRPGKVAAPKPLVTKRSVLGELGNKLNSQDVNQSNAHKKAVSKPDVKPVPSKTQKPTLKTAPSNKTATNSVVTEKKAVKEATKSKPDCLLKCEESALSKHIARAGNDYKIGEDVSYSSKQLGIIDADAKDKDDPFLVTEYIQDIFSYFRSLESDHKIRENYLSTHCSTPRMRSILINWMVDVHVNFKFLLETLHLSVAIVDRYLQLNNNIGRETLQLVGITALLIAGKYEEMYMPEINDFVYICDNTFTHSQILRMELDILSKLKWCLGRPLALHFLRRYNKVACVQPEHHNLAKYLLEIFLLEYELCHINPSVQAAAASCLSMSILNEVSDPSKVWNKTMVYYSTYKYSDIKPVVIKLAYFLVKMEKSKFQAIRKKYANANLSKISLNPHLHGPLVKKLVEEAQLAKAAASDKTV